MSWDLLTRDPAITRVLEAAFTGSQTETGAVQATIEVPSLPEVEPITIPVAPAGTNAILVFISLIAWPIVSIVTNIIKHTLKVNGANALLIVAGLAGVVYTIVTALLDQATIQAILWYTGTSAAVAVMVYNYIKGKNREPYQE